MSIGMGFGIRWIRFNEYEGYAPGGRKPRYRLEYGPDADTAPSRFGSIDYTSWLPPFRRRVYIDQFKHPWWLDVKPTDKGITPLEYESYYD